MAKTRGFTLMELLVVLLIIGVLSTVTVRTIDATRNRALFDQTAAEMSELVKAMVGDPDLLTDGHRVDFGFYGDMGRLPEDLRELVESNAPRWRGPYVRRRFAGDSLGFMYDGWGNPYTYDKGTGTISSLGNGQNPLTVRVADSLDHLESNTIAGTVTDSDNNPPGDIPILLGLYTADGEFQDDATADRGGYYEFEGVPIGQYRLVADYGLTGDDTIARWVTVPPRSRLVVDFRFSRPFRNLVRMVGSPQLYGDSSGFSIAVVNDYVDEIILDSIVIKDGPADSSGVPTAYLRDLKVNGTSWTGYPVYTGLPGYGTGDALPLDGGLVIEPNRSEIVTLGFLDFYGDSLGPPGERANLAGQGFRLRFSDGSEIGFDLPSGP